MAEQRLEEMPAGLQPHHRQEQHDADLAQRQVGTGGHEPVHLADGADPRQHDGRHQRPAGQTQLQRHRQPRHRHGNGAQQHAQTDADEHGQHLHLLQLLLGVAHQRHHGLDVFLPAHQVDHVAELQRHAAGGHQFDTGPVQARDHHVVVGLQVQVTDLLADHGLVGDHRPFRAVGRVVDGGAVDELLADDHLHAPQCRWCSHQIQHVAQRQPRIHTGNEELLAPAQPRVHHVVPVEIGNVGDAHPVQIGVGDAHVAALQPVLALAEALLVLMGLGGDVDAKHQPDQPHGEQDAQNADRVGNGIAHAHHLGGLLATQLGQRLLPGAQRGRVGDRPGEDAQNHPQRHVHAQVQGHHQHATECHDGHGHPVETQPAVPQRRKEARPHLVADGVDEEDQAEFLDEMQRVLVEHEVVAVEPVPYQNAAEQDAADTQADAADADVSNGQAEHGHQGKQADGEGYVAHDGGPRRQAGCSKGRGQPPSCGRPGCMRRMAGPQGD